ncbi:MAG: tail fiber domain-containing protein [Bacteroidales bacterium]|nr:tail fiber domain-containing protein [Bacteroidales bacterium]
MKSLSFALLILCFLFLFSGMVAQTPQGISYQAVARDAGGDLLASTNVGLRISITNGNGGTLLYRETHNTNTNSLGLFTLTVGGGTPVSGNFTTINWSGTTPWLHVELDPAGGTNYVDMGTSQMLSVPYALHSKSSAAVSGSTGSISKFVSPGSLGNSVITENNNNIGIGITSPYSKLYVKGNENIPQLIVEGPSAQTNINPLIKLIKNGSEVMWINSDDFRNVFVGYQSGISNNSTGGGIFNLNLGIFAGASNTVGSKNVAAGGLALYNNVGASGSTAIGYYAMRNANSTTATSLTNNVAVGYEALSGSANPAANTGVRNTAIGSTVLKNNTSGTDNTGCGYLSLSAVTTGKQNTVAGSNALIFSETGNDNTAMGFGSQYSTYTGFRNTSLGSNSMLITSTGSYNTAVGYNTGANTESFFNTTCVGIDATATASNMVRLGNVFVTSIGGYQNWTNISDGRFKSEVKENVPGLDFINKLRPVTYRLDREKINDFIRVDKHKSAGTELASSSDPDLTGDAYSAITSGFIAQEVESAARETGYDFSGIDEPKNDGDPYGLRYAEFVVPLVKAVQELDRKVESLQKENAELKAQVASMRR